MSTWTNLNRVSSCTLYLLALAGCSSETFLNQTASFGGDQAGGRGTVSVGFINNTPFRSVFSYGTYNNTNQFEQPVVQQFVGNSGGSSLEGDEVAEMVTLPCNRVFAIGDPEMNRLIEENLDEEVLEALDEDVLFDNIAFSSAALGEPNSAVATEGFAPYVRALLGVDFSCGSILIIRFEISDVGPAPFRADFEVIPPEDDDRGN